MSERTADRPSAAGIEALSLDAIARLWSWVERQPEEGPGRRSWQVEEGGDGPRLVHHGTGGDHPGAALAAWALVLVQAGAGDERARYALGEVSGSPGEIAGLRALARRLKEARPTWGMPSLPAGEEGEEHALQHRIARHILEIHEAVRGLGEGRGRRSREAPPPADPSAGSPAREEVADDRTLVDKEYLAALERSYLVRRMQVVHLEGQIRDQINALQERCTRIEARLDRTDKLLAEALQRVRPLEDKEAPP
jgi:hypothetical protein